MLNSHLPCFSVGSRHSVWPAMSSMKAGSFPCRRAAFSHRRAPLHASAAHHRHRKIPAAVCPPLRAPSPCLARKLWRRHRNISAPRSRHWRSRSPCRDRWPRPTFVASTRRAAATEASTSPSKSEPRIFRTIVARRLAVVSSSTGMLLPFLSLFCVSPMQMPEDCRRPVLAIENKPSMRDRGRSFLAGPAVQMHA